MAETRRLAGRYRLEARLGQGAMGIVWRARDEMLGRDVAVKELLAPTGLDEDQRRAAARRALREARSAALLRHPGIITVHDVVEEDGRPWIVMELLSGRSLEQVDPLPPERAARVGLEVLSALRAAHAQGVLHRDVKPANIFERDDGRVVLTDFGIASLDGDASLTRTGALMGSPAFMAPERARGEPGGPESDLWSLGITLYALVEGRTPFSRSTVMGTLGAVLTAPPDQPRAAGPLAPVLLALLAKDPSVRLTADGTEAALRTVTGPAGASGVPPTVPSSPVPPRPVQAVPPTVPVFARTARGHGSRPTAALAVLAALTVLGVVAGVVAVVVRAQGDAPPPSRPSRTSVTSRPAEPAARFGTRPNPCGLITAEQATRFIHGRFMSSRSTDTKNDACSWSTAIGVKGPEYSVDITVRAVLPGTAASPVADARKAYAEQRDGDAPFGGTPDPTRPFRDLPGLGDQAYLHELPDRDGGDATVVLRVSNVIVEVRHGARGVGNAQDGLRSGALQLARWAAVALTR